MTISKFDLRPSGSRVSKLPPTVELPYVCVGGATLEEVRTFAIAHAPISQSLPAAMDISGTVLLDSAATLYQNEVKVEEVGHRLHHVDIVYSKRLDVIWEFSTTGGTFHVNTSRSTTATQPAGAENFYRAINVTREGGKLKAEGVDIVIPALRVSAKVRFPAGVITQAEMIQLAALTGQVNRVDWNGFLARTLLFLGAEGALGEDVPTEVTYHFAFEPTVNLTYQVHTPAGIQNVNVTKSGHDFLWLSFVDAVDDGRPVIRPRAVYVERLYNDFSPTLLGF